MYVSCLGKLLSLSRHVRSPQSQFLFFMATTRKCMVGNISRCGIIINQRSGIVLILQS